MINDVIMRETGRTDTWIDAYCPAPCTPLDEVERMAIGKRLDLYVAIFVR